LLGVIVTTEGVGVCGGGVVVGVDDVKVLEGGVVEWEVVVVEEEVGRDIDVEVAVVRGVVDVTVDDGLLAGDGVVVEGGGVSEDVAGSGVVLVLFDIVKMRPY
jgi:hypothetical protein